MKPLYVSVFILVLYFTHVFAITSTLVLHLADSVVAGQTAVYNCSSIGDGLDPTLQWSITHTYQNVQGDTVTDIILSNSQLSSQIVDGSADSTDGAVKSMVSFTVLVSYLNNYRLFCEAIDVGGSSTSPNAQIYTIIYPTTTSTAELDQACSSTVTCSPANAACVSSFCTCNDGFYDTNSNVAGGSCSPSLGLGSTCPAGIDAACSTTYSRCSQTSPFTCECDTGYVQSGSICVLSSASIGGSCTSPTRTCPSNANCNTGTCQCNSGYVYSSTAGSCISSTAAIYETCTSPTRTCPSNANCNTGTCQCNSGYIYSSTAGSCIISTADNGETCISPTRTCPSNANCNTGTCQCNSGYIYSSTLGYCISSTANIGDQCVDPTRSCISNAGCVGSLCVCNTGYYYRASTETCTIQATVGSGCSTSESDSCADGQASCVGSTNPTCLCNTGYVLSDGFCVVDSAATSCPTSSVSSTIVGEVSPSAPDVYVRQTCYKVNLQATEVMECKDSKGMSSLQSARWLEFPSYVAVVASTGAFINGDISNPNLTVSNAQSSYAGQYVCQLCYGSSFTRCTNSSPIALIVIGRAITSVSASVSPSAAPVKNTEVTLTCTVEPLGGAYEYVWLYKNTQVSTIDTYTIASVQTTFAGSYGCEATNSYGSMISPAVTLDVQYAPEPSGGTTQNVPGDFANGDITITCIMTANPAITSYYFYDEQNNQLQNSGSDTYSVTSSNGYATYSCRTVNSIGQSKPQYIEVTEDSSPNTGASTVDTGLGTGTIAAIVLGIIFLLLFIIIIIVCCCSYGWCRKKERIEPQIVEKPLARPYLPRNIVSAKSTVSRKDVGVTMNGYRNGFVSTEVEEPRYTTPRYHLKPAMNGGPIISIFDDGYDQPRAHQLPALDTQYLYTDNEPKKHKKKKRRHRHRHHHDDRDVSPRRRQYEEVDEPVRYAEAVPPSDEDLVVIPGNKQNYFE